MAIKYISKNKDGVWKVSVSKMGKAIKTFETQKEAIAYAGTIKNTESILIKRESGWQQATGWDLNVANEAKAVEEKHTAKGKSKKEAKAHAVAKATDKPVETSSKPEAAKAEIKTETVKLETKEEAKTENKQKSSAAKKTKAHMKKHKKSYIGWTLFYLFLIGAVAAGILIYWFCYK